MAKKPAGKGKEKEKAVDKPEAKKKDTVPPPPAPAPAPAVQPIPSHEKPALLAVQEEPEDEMENMGQL